MRTFKALAPGMIMIIVSLVFLSQTFAMEKASLLDPAGGSFLPALIIVVMIITGITVIIQDRPKKKKIENDTQETTTQSVEDNSDRTNETEDTSMTMEQYRTVLTFFVLTILYVLSISILSFSIATFIFLCVSMFFLRGVSWKTTILVSIGSIIVFNLVFTQLFNIIFP